jgi:hypothetical protein
MATAKINIGAETADYVSEIKKIPGITDKEAEKAGKAFRNKLINQAIKGLDEVEDKAKSAVDATGKATDKLGGQLLDLGELVGVPADKLKKLGAGVEALANPMGIAAVAAGSVAFAAAGAAAAIVTMVDAADELARELKGIKGLGGLEGFGISSADLTSLDQANAALASIGTIGRQVVVTLGAEFAPAVTEVATEVVKFGLIALDAFNQFAEGGDILRGVAEFMTGKLVKAITAPVNALTILTNTMARVAEAAGADGLATQLRKADEAYEGFVKSASSSAVDALAGGFERLSGLTGDYDARARQLISTMQTHAATQRDAAAAAKELAEAEKEAAAIEAERQRLTHQISVEHEKLISDYDRVAMAAEDAATSGASRVQRELAGLDGLSARLQAEGALTVERERVINDAKTKIVVDYTNTVIAERQRQDEADAAAAAAEVERNRATRDAKLQAITSTADAAISASTAVAQQEYQIRSQYASDLERALSDKEANLTDSQRAEMQERLDLARKQAKRAFAISKALSIAQIAVSTAEAAMSAFAQGMKMGGPVGAAALVAATLAVGGLQTAVVARQKPPAHRGLVPVGGAAADEGMTMLTNEEAVLSPRGVEAAGGPEGVSNLNAGGGSMGGGTTTVNLQFGLRTMDTVTASALSRPGESRAMVRKGNPVGHRRNRRGD